MERLAYLQAISYIGIGIVPNELPDLEWAVQTYF